MGVKHSVLVHCFYYQDDDKCSSTAVVLRCIVLLLNLVGLI